MKKILLVEDNESLIMGLKYSLEQENFIVEVSKNLKSAIFKIDTQDFDLFLLDISLPDGNGFEVCKYIKSKVDLPVIFLTARDEEKNIIYGLDLGADDYITKPFSVRELISRINAIMRRYNKGKEEKTIICFKNIRIDVTQCKVYKDEKEIILTSLEYKILLMLVQNKNILVTREQLLEKIWDIAGNFVNDNTLTVYIKRIREKIEDDAANPTIIKTVRGIGYRVGDK